MRILCFLPTDLCTINVSLKSFCLSAVFNKNLWIFFDSRVRPEFCRRTVMIVAAASGYESTPSWQRGAPVAKSIFIYYWKMGRTNCIYTESAPCMCLMPAEWLLGKKHATRNYFLQLHNCPYMDEPIFRTSSALYTAERWNPWLTGKSMWFHP